MKISIKLINTIPDKIKELSELYKFEAKNNQYLFTQDTLTLYVGTVYDKNPIETNDFDKTLYHTLGSNTLNKLPSEVKEINIESNDVDELDIFNFVSGVKTSLFSYNFRDKSKIKKIKVTCDSKEISNEHKAIEKGIYFTKKVVDMNPFELNPTTYVDILDQQFTNIKPWIKTTIIRNTELEKLGMKMLTSVGRGSRHGANLFIIEIEPIDSEFTTHCLIGKGLTFDTGGVNIKENGGSFGMQDDMGGSATVFGVATKLLNLEQPKNKKIIILSGIVENVTDGNSYLPGEILENIAGQTSIIKNTDAEGRLTLSDVVAYATINFKPDEIITLATLTGAAISSFTGFSSPIFSNNKTIRNQIYKSFLKNEEEAIEIDLPSSVYRTGIKDSTGRSDMSNTGSYPVTMGIRVAGSQTAAAFVMAAAQPKLYSKNKDGLNESYSITHIDIAGTVVDQKGNATGYGVRSLSDYLVNGK